MTSSSDRRRPRRRARQRLAPAGYIWDRCHDSKPTRRPSSDAPRRPGARGLDGTWSTLLIVLSSACGPARHLAHAPPGEAGEADERRTPPSASIAATTVRDRLVVDDLRGLACDAAARCVVQRGQALVALSLDPLATGETLAELPADERLVQWHGPAVLGPCSDGVGRCVRPLSDADLWPGPPSTTDGSTGAPPELPLVPAPSPTTPAALRARWNQAIARAGRSPFAARVPSPIGGSLVWLAHPTPRVMATGAGVRFLLLAQDDAREPIPVRYQRALALHPTGAEAYLLAWPDGDLVAFDPRRLQPRWTIPLQHAAHGLFIDGDGRLLLVEEGGHPDPDQLLDLGVDEPALPASAEIGGDIDLALSDRPDAERTAVVDLALPRLVWRQAGRYRGLITLPDGDRLLATDRELARLSVPPTPVAAAPPADTNAPP